MTVEQRIEQLYGPLPQAPSPVAAYVPVVQAGKLLFLSGQGPIINGEQKFTGRVGEDVTMEEGYEAARLCCVNLLAQLKKYIGDLDRVRRVVSVKVYIASGPDFFDQPKVANGMSEFLEQVFGELGRHSLTIQYGGSMNAKNCAELLSKENVDGGLIGGASLKAADFNTIVQAAVEG